MPSFSYYASESERPEVQGANGRQNHCEGKGASARIATPNDDNPGFMAKETEHCFRLIRSGQTYYLTIEGTVLCADCALVEGVIRVRGDLAVEIKRDRLLIRRGEVGVEVLPGEIRHLVNALTEAAVRLVDQQEEGESVAGTGGTTRKYPGMLEPVTVEEIHLPSGITVEVPKTTPVFDMWTGERIADTYGGKAVLDFDSEPVFAELAILRAFQDSGWNGVWVDAFSKKYRVGYWGENTEAELPSEQAALLGRIDDRVGGPGGCWDVFCWTGSLHLFAEAKRRGRDRIRSTQSRWLEAAMEEELPVDSFLVVEWTARS